MCLPKIAGSDSAALYLPDVFATFGLCELGRDLGPWKNRCTKYPLTYHFPILGDCKGADIFPYRYAAEIFSARLGKKY